MSLVGGSTVQLTNSRPMHVLSVDANGDPVFSGSGGGTMGSTATIVSLPASSVSITLQAANGSRKSLHIGNTSNKTLLVAYAATATTGLYTEVVPSGQTLLIRDYTGVVSGIWDANNPNGTAKVTEVV